MISKITILTSILALALMLTALGCGGGVVIKEAATVPTDRPLYGFTADGVFFVHESIITNTGAKTVVFVSEVSSMKGRAMTLKSGYWIYDVNRLSGDKVDFERYSGKGLAVRYCFIIGNNLQIPREIMNKTGWIAKDDITEVEGIPFIATRPVENKFIQ